jgi:hypothetical protein
MPLVSEKVARSGFQHNLPACTAPAQRPSREGLAHDIAPLNPAPNRDRFGLISWPCLWIRQDAQVNVTIAITSLGEQSIILGFVVQGLGRDLPL